MGSAPLIISNGLIVLLYERRGLCVGAGRSAAASRAIVNGMATTTPKAVLQADTKKRISQKRNTWHKWLAILYAVQGIVFLLFSATALFPVQTSYLTQNSLASEMTGSSVLVTATHHLFDLNLAYIVAAVFFVAAIVHGVVATLYRKRYTEDAEQGINRTRWLECGLSASIMLVAIAVVSGVADLVTLILIFVLAVLASLLGVAIEIYRQTKTKTHILYVLTGIACIAPVVVLGLYVWGAAVYGGGHVPAFVYWIYASMLVLFGGFVATMYLQRKKTGPWKNPLYSERAFMILSFTAKTLVAWQIFAGALRP
jgi:hypothetical protein